VKRTVQLHRLALFTLLLASPLAQAELRDAGPGGFTTRHVVDLAVPPAELYRVLVEEVSQWWDPAHSWSGDAANLYIEAKPGGCFCERLADGGWVEHLHIVYLAPGKEIRLQGALGPLQQMGLQGAMSWLIEPIENGSRLSFTYIVHGYQEDGFKALGPGVDSVIGMQLQRLAARLGSG